MRLRTPTHLPANYNNQQDVLDTDVIRPTAVPMYVESVEEPSSDHNPVILVMGMEHYETTLTRMDHFTVNWAY
jgi:hypothetical protein